MPKLTLIFDLDGTLVDTAPDLTAAMNHVLTENGRRPVPPDEVRHMVGHGARKLIERGFAATGTPVDDDALPGMMQQFITYYGAHIADGSRPYPGVLALLEAHRKAGTVMGVCTNKPEGLARSLLDALDMSNYFRAILGADTLPVRKPDPQHLLETIARSGGDVRRAVMIGDSEVDAETAKRAGVKLVIFSGGYTALDPATFGADELIGHYDEMQAALAGIAASLP